MLSEVYYSFEAIVRDVWEIQRDVITVAAGQNLPANAVITKTFVGTGTAAMAAGSTGNPTSGAITVGSLAMAGIYSCYFTAATTFEIFAPDLRFLGTGVLGTAVNIGNQIGFTLTAGGTACVAGDQMLITVAEGASTWSASVTGNDAMGILGPATNATSGAVQSVAVTRLAEFNANLVNYGSLSQAQIAAANAALARKNLIARSY